MILHAQEAPFTVSIPVVGSVPPCPPLVVDLTAAWFSEVCSHSVCGSGAFAQQGYELLPAKVSPVSTAPPTLVCGGCGRYLKRTYPQLLLRETEGVEVFQCMFWRTHNGVCCEGRGGGGRDRLCMCVLVTERDYRDHLL